MVTTAYLEELTLLTEDMKAHAAKTRVTEQHLLECSDHLKAAEQAFREANVMHETAEHEYRVATGRLSRFINEAPEKETV